MKNILEYQKLDNQLHKLRRESVNNQERDVMNKMISYVKDAQGKTGQLEREATKLVNDYAQLKTNYNNTSNQVNKLLQMDVKTMSSEQLNTTFGQVNKLSSDLFMLERKLNFVITNAKNLLKQFEVTKNNVLKARAKHKESKEKYERIQKEYEPKIKEVEAQMAQLEKVCDKQLLAKYKQLKSENIFPVFVSLAGDTCGGCRMAIASNKLGKLHESGHIICEHCGRIIYEQK